MQSTIIRELDENSKNKFLDVVTSLHSSNESISPEALLQFIKLGFTTEKALDIVGCFIDITQSFLHSDPKDFHKKLVLAGYTDSFIETLIERLHNIHIKPVELNRTISFKWRIDISFFDRRSLQTIPVPVVFSIKKDSKHYVIEVDTRAFHKLRFAVALIMKHVLSTKKTLKL